MLWLTVCPRRAQVTWQSVTMRRLMWKGVVWRDSHKNNFNALKPLSVEQFAMAKTQGKHGQYTLLFQCAYRIVQICSICILRTVYLQSCICVQYTYTFVTARTWLRRCSELETAREVFVKYYPF